MSRNVNTQLKDTLATIVGDEFKHQLLEDLGTALMHRASRIGKQKKQVLSFDPGVSADVTREDARYIRSMCTSSRRNFGRL